MFKLKEYFVWLTPKRDPIKSCKASKLKQIGDSQWRGMTLFLALNIYNEAKRKKNVGK
jgi:hypothetical protein